MPDLRLGDIIFVNSDGWFSRAIHWFSRSPGEGKTFASHVGLMLDGKRLIEAVLWRVKIAGLDKYQSTPHEIWRCTALSAAGRARIMARALRYRRMEYGFLKLLAHGLDGLLVKLGGGRDIYFFRRMACMDRYPICSWLVAYSYSAVNYDFKKPAWAVQPDDIHDYVLSSPDWQRIK